VNIRFDCPVCEYPGRLSVPGLGSWHCPRCEHVVTLPENAGDPALPACVICGGHELYKKKDFPHGLGMAILVFACLASTVTYFLYLPRFTWAILIGSAAFDGLLYLWVKDAVVCYRCHASHGGLPPGSAHPPFELTIHERYRQERLRREQMKNNAPS
jgi:hypothetical protein